ncbi:MAG: LysR family transcriptional regulator [Myxococcota bacterium]
MDELDAMRTFVQVVESGSFSAAARVLGTTQPSVSRRVAALEQDLGATLLARSTRSLALTEVGERYLEAARRTVAGAEAARRAAEVGATGRLRITAPVSFSTAWLAPRLPAFFADHPDLEPSFHFTETHVDLIAEGMDLALRIGGPESPELVGRRAARIRRRLVASPAWRAERSLAGPADLADAHALVFTREMAWRGWPARFEGQELRVRPGRVTRATSGDFLRVLALAGEGVALLPEWLIDADLAEGRLVEVLPTLELPTLDLWVVWPEQRFQGEAARRFVAWFVAEAKASWGGS